MKYRTLLACAITALLTAAAVSQAQVPGINSTLNSVFTLAYDNSTMKPTYSAFVANIAAVSTQSDMCSLSGSSTKTIKVRRIFFGNTPTGAYTEPVTILKRSTAYTAGAGAAISKVAYDTSNAASTVNMAEVWTSAPTVGTLIGVLTDVPISFGISTSLNVQPVFTFGQLGQPIVLRGVAQQVAINLSGVTLTGTVSCGFEWTEE